METLKEEQKPRKTKGGRPKKPVKRQRMVCVRFTRSEHFIAAQRAEKAKLSLSDYIRESALRAVVKARLSEDDRHFFRQLTGLSNNLNQLTKLAHQQGLFAAMMHFEKELKQIDELLNRFKK
jgi:hypothetical protein